MRQHSDLTNKINSFPDVERTIISFPQSYLLNATPYKSYDFSPQVREKCTTILGVNMTKVVFAGEVAVGKTSLIQRFCHNSFNQDYKATIGVDFEVEKFYIHNMPFKVQLWDTAGQERFKCIAASYYRASNAVVIVFDMNSMESLHKAKQWKEEACKNIETSSPLIFLVGTKRDLVSDSVWKNIESVATGLAKEIGAELWIVSSRNGERIKDFFFRLAAILFEDAVLRESTIVYSPRKDSLATDLIQIEERLKEKTKCCQ